ncbi:hypothetical protein WK76_25000 [Burkholderia ubonensis]|nr:hypothetical protein WK76_25000 [Burkholderia ubonensis]
MPPTPQLDAAAGAQDGPRVEPTAPERAASASASAPAQTEPRETDEQNAKLAHPDGMPSLNVHRSSAGGIGKRWLSMLAIAFVVAGGAVWAVHRVIADRAAQNVAERNAVANQPQSQGGRTFADTAPPAPQGASAPGVASNGGVPVPPVSQLPPTGQPTTMQAAGPSMAVARATPPVSWFDADLMVGEGHDVALAPAGEQVPSAQTTAAPAPTGGLAGTLTSTALRPSQASVVVNRDLLLSAGAKIPCAGDTAFDSTLAGVSTCTVTSNVYSDTGKVLLLERGSTVNTEFRSLPTQGQRRVFILSARIETPHGVKVPIDSPAADALGRMGIDGDVDNHWGERIGAAFMLSLVQDSIGYLVSRGSGSGANGTVVFQNTQQTGSDMAGKVLNSTINLPPTIGKNQGADFLIVLARDLDFSGVYALEAK